MGAGSPLFENDFSGVILQACPITINLVDLCVAQQVKDPGPFGTRQTSLFDYLAHDYDLIFFDQGCGESTLPRHYLS